MIISLEHGPKNDQIPNRLFFFFVVLRGNWCMHAQSLYERGARKFGVAGLPPVGCLPLQVTVGSMLPSEHMLQRLCVAEQNDDAKAYNNKLQNVIIPRLTTSLHGSKIVYFDIFESMMDMVLHPNTYGTKLNPS